MISASRLLQEREEFIRLLPTFTDKDFSHVWWRQEHESLGVHNTTDKLVAGLQSLLRRCEIVIWNIAVQNMSMSGAGDVFMEQPVPQELCPTNQLWIREDGEPYSYDASDWHDWLAIDEDCICYSALVTMTPPQSSAVFLPLIGLKSGEIRFRWVHSGPLLSDPVAKDEYGQTGPISAAVFASRLFIDSKIPNVQHAELTPKAIKHWTKKRKLTIPTIRFITLRESERHKTDGMPRNVEFSHRWICKAHWRLQACGPNLSSRRPTFIFPHVKGPSDKPLIIKQTIFNAVR